MSKVLTTAMAIVTLGLARNEHRASACHQLPASPLSPRLRKSGVLACAFGAAVGVRTGARHRQRVLRAGFQRVLK